MQLNLSHAWFLTGVWLVAYLRGRLVVPLPRRAGERRDLAPEVVITELRRLRGVGAFEDAPRSEAYTAISVIPTHIVVRGASAFEKWRKDWGVP